MKSIQKVGPHIFQSKESINRLREVGFNYVSLANNHIYDYGQQGLEQTIFELNKNYLNFIGGGLTFDEAYDPKIIDKNGIKIGLLAACENEFGCLYEKQPRGGYAWLFHALLEDNIKILKKTCDYVILIAHSGVEDISFPIKEWRDRYKRLCDIGVDVVIGHHPHVPQGYEKHHNSLIFYSLGNFYFDTASFQDKSDDSYSVLFKFKQNKELDFEIIYHKKINGLTSLVSEQDVNFDLSNLNIILFDSYLEKNDNICIELFNRYYYSYYENALGSISNDTTLRHKLKYFLKILLKKNLKSDIKNLLLLHNIRIDSHRFLVQRALSKISEKI
jgi:poly-gamma-glutamate synthesis protein (capsule biosynthesis protein)